MGNGKKSIFDPRAGLWILIAANIIAFSDHTLWVELALIALLAALTMLFVCGCGSNSKDNGTDNGNGTNNGTNNAVDERRDTNTNTVGDDVREGVDDAGNAVGDAVDDAGNAIRDGADAVTGDNNNAAKQPNTANGTNAPAENP